MNQRTMVCLRSAPAPGRFGVELRTSILSISLLLLSVACSLTAQPLPRSATPRGVIFAFLTETASSNDSIDRLAFAERLHGELARTDPRSFRGMLPAEARISIDSLPDLPAIAEGERRAVAYTTVADSISISNIYIFCSRDSIWRIDAVRQFPTMRQRSQILSSLATLDTQTISGRYLRADLQRVMLPDDSLAGILRSNLNDAQLIVERLTRGKRWREFILRDVDFSSLDEYRELDDDIDPNEFIFYRLDRNALERLKQRAGIRKFQRDSRYPGAIFLVGASVQGDTYGYVYSPDQSWLPPISGREFIMLKPVAENWWVYKRMKEE